MKVYPLSSAMYFHEVCKDVLFCASHLLLVWLKLALKFIKTDLKPGQVHKGRGSDEHRDACNLWLHCLISLGNGIILRK